MTGGYQPNAAQIAEVRQANKAAPIEQDIMLRYDRDTLQMVDYWRQVEDIINGIKAMRNGSELYLPKFVQEDATTYEYRLKCTKMTNVYRDIVEGLAAKPFEEEITLPDGEKEDETKPPQQIMEFCENVDGAGNNLSVFSALSFFNAINNAIDWIFVDNPVIDKTTVRTVEEARAAGIRPYWSRVLAKNVRSVKSKMNGSSELITYIRIFEPGDVDHVRVLERSDTGVVTNKLYVKKDAWRDVQGGQTQYHLESETTLEIDVVPLVPIIVGRRDGKAWVFDPVLRDAADLQVDLYQSESALKYIKQLSAYPMLSGNGIKPQLEADGKTPQKILVGPGRVLYAPMDGNGNAGSWAYVEPGAQSMTFLASDIETTQQALRELGRQPLTAQSGNLTVITAATAAGKARTAVGAWALGLQDALENAFVITSKFLGVKYDPIVSVYTDFDEFVEGKDTESILTAAEKKIISRETARHEMRRRGVLSVDNDEETEKKRLLDETAIDDENADDDPPVTDKKK